MENKITSGIWFVFIGIVLLLHNLDIIDFNFWATLTYWPLLIVIVGINLMVQNRRFGGYIKIACNALFLGWIFYIGISTPGAHWTETLLNNRQVNIGDLDDGAPLTNEVKTSFDNTIQESRLEFNGGAGNFEIKAVEGDNLILAKAKDDKMGMTIQTSKQDGKQHVTINAKPTANSKKSGTVSLEIHPQTTWDFEFNYGAASINGDLSALRFRNLDINTGASSMDLTLGMPQVDVSYIAIVTGASKIHFRIPKDAAIQVEYTSVLSKNSFEGFATKEDGVARTANYEHADKKFNIDLDGAANTFVISRY